MLGFYRQAVDAEELADAGDDQVRPLAVHDGGEDEVEPEVPQLEAGGDGTECCPSDGEVGVVDQEGTADHGDQHDSPVWERLVGEVSKDDFRRHAAKDQRHGQAVEDQVVVFQDERVWRTQPSHGSDTKDNQRGPFKEQRHDGQVLGATCLHYVYDAGWQMSNKEGEQDHGYPNFSEAHVTEQLLVSRQIFDQRRRPDLGSKVARHAHEGAS